MKLRHLAIVLGLFIIAGCNLNTSNSSALWVDYTNPQLTYSGRIDSISQDAACLHWSGSSVKINFEGESVHAILKDEFGLNYYNIILDNDSIILLDVDTIKQAYTLVENLSAGKHSLELFKRNEWAMGKTFFYGFKVVGNAKILDKDASKIRKMEFYGNSITQGYGIEDYTGTDRYDSTFTNHYLTYAAITARHFNADRNSICKGGIGIMLSWFDMIMPEMYNRLDPSDSTSVWDFSLFTPDVVVVNLFQNDSWLVERPKFEQFKKRFGTEAPNNNFIVDSYKSFITTLREQYPDANIICMLGTMDITREGSKWPGLVERAVAELDDEKIYSYFIPFKNSGGHPRVHEQKAMAESLIAFIEENIEW